MTPDIVEMRAEFFQRLGPVRGRLRAGQLLAVIEQSLLPAVLIATVLCVFRFAYGFPSAWIVSATALAPLVLAAVWGLARDIAWLAIARAIDQRYALADRTLTALANLQQFERDLKLPPTAELQLRDALEHLKQIQAREVVGLRMSGRTSSLMFLLVLILVADVVIPPDKLAGGLTAFVGHTAVNSGAQPLAADSPLAQVPPEALTQPAPGGRSAGPLERQQNLTGSYLGDNAATERYFERMDRPPSPSLQSLLRVRPTANPSSPAIDDSLRLLIEWLIRYVVALDLRLQPHAAKSASRLPRFAAAGVPDRDGSNGPAPTAVGQLCHGLSRQST